MKSGIKINKTLIINNFLCDGHVIIKEKIVLEENSTTFFKGKTSLKNILDYRLEELFSNDVNTYPDKRSKYFIKQNLRENKDPRTEKRFK